MPFAFNFVPLQSGLVASGRVGGEGSRRPARVEAQARFAACALRQSRPGVQGPPVGPMSSTKAPQQDNSGPARGQTVYARRGRGKELCRHGMICDNDVCARECKVVH